MSETGDKKQIKNYSITVCVFFYLSMFAVDTANPLDTRLADRIATLNSTIASNSSQAPEAEPPSNPDQKVSAATLQPQLPRGPEAMSRMRQDLSDAQRSRGEMQARLQLLTEEMQTLILQSKVGSKQVNELTAERNALVTRIRDRDEELREKAKLLVVGFLPILES